jgi:hypothetical protein
MPTRVLVKLATAALLIMILLLFAPARVDFVYTAF